MAVSVSSEICALAWQIAVQLRKGAHPLGTIGHLWQIDLVASPGGNQRPGIALIIDGGCTGAMCTGTGLAVILACQRYAIALFLGLA